MGNILMWAGIALIVIGWVALAWQASKRLAVKDELDKLTQKRETMQSHRNYCWLIIGAGMILLLISIVV